MREIPTHTRVAIVGSGFAGLGAAIKLKQDGVDDVVILERASDLGGTWRDNSYPGCRCDVPSHLYSFSFDPNPNWSETYSPQPEIWDYLRRTADRFGVESLIRYDSEVTKADWDEEAQVWRVETVRGALTADVLVAATGGLSEPSTPALPGLETFRGTSFHSAEWNHDYDLSGKRVAVIGTGASAIQIVPEIQPEVGKLTLFQRTPPWVMPDPRRRITDRERRLYKAFPAAQRAVRTAVYWGLESLVVALAYRPSLMKIGEVIARRNIALQIPDDPELRRKLTPDYRLGCKRILKSNKYYRALAKPNSEVVTAGISEVTPTGIRTADGAEHELDAIIFGTGFKVMDLPVADRVRGREGKLLRDAWQGSPKAYLGTTIAEMPNLFVLVGPNTGLGHNSIVHMIESQLTYLSGAVRALRENDLGSVEVRPEVQQAFNDEVQRKMKGTVWSEGGCSSWYLDDQGRNFTLWPRFTWQYRMRTAKFDLSEYLTTPRVPAREEEPVAA